MNPEVMLQRLAAATSDEAREWVVTEIFLESLEPELARALWAVAVPHWFDAEILAALEPELAARATELYGALQELSVVEPFEGRGHNVHEKTRGQLLARLLAERSEEVRAWSARAAAVFGERFVAGSQGFDRTEQLFHWRLFHSSVAELAETKIDRQAQTWVNDFGLNSLDRSQQGVIHCSEAKVSDRSEAKLLAAVKTEVAMRLAQSLHQRVYVELHKEEDPRQVVQPWAVDAKLGSAAAVRCPDGTRIIEIFDRAEIGGRLLILGAPGSGKTTMLLQLADELVRRSVENPARPVPVLLNLSAWKEEFKDISSWMVADLKLKYRVRKDIAQKWIEEGRILPLLDGLDELMSDRQETCVRALNAFLPGWSGMPLVVCSRLAEYQAYGENLGLNGAVILQPMKDEQIERFLRGAKCDWLWEAVRDDADVMDAETGLARSPLLLTILVLASDGLPLDLFQKEESAEERRQILFEAYIAERLKRRYAGGKNLPPTKRGQKPYKDDEKTKAWLGWLAMWLIKENQTEFFIEKLQPRFLATRWQKFVYGLIYGLFGGLVFGLVGGLFLGLIFPLIFGIFGGLIFGLIVGSLYGLAGKTGNIQTVEVIKFSWRFAPRKFLSSLLGGLFSGLLLELFGKFFGGLFGGLTFGLIIGLLLGLFRGIIEWSIETNWDTKNKDNQGIYQSIFNSFIIGLIFIPVGILVIFAMMSWNESQSLKVVLATGAAIGFLSGASARGLLSAIAHFSLRITLWIFGYGPWNYSKFLRYCTDRGFLQRVGGSYRFVHALLRDYFAEHYAPK